MITRISVALIALLCGFAAKVSAQIDSTIPSKTTVSVELGPNYYSAIGFDYGISGERTFGSLTACFEIYASTRTPTLNSGTAEGSEWDSWDVLHGYQLLASIHLPLSRMIYAAFGIGLSIISDATTYVGVYPNQAGVYALPISKSSPFFMVGLGTEFPLSKSLLIPLNCRLLMGKDKSTVGSPDLTEIGIGLTTGLGVIF